MADDASDLDTIDGRMQSAARYVVSRPFPTSNVGSNLASIAGALYLAARLRRTLVLDWRGLTQLADPDANYFSEFLALRPHVDGAPVLVAPVSGLEYDAGAAGVEWLSPDEAARLAASGTDPESRAIVLQPYHGLDRLHPGPESERFRLLRSLYRRLRPAPAVERLVEEWADDHLAGPFVVGLNVRTGNGHYFGKGEEYAGRVDISIFDDQRRFLRALERGCRARVRRLPRPLRDDFRIFYATDSQPMSELLARLPNAVTRRTVFPPPGSGDTFRFEGEGYSDRNSVEDTLADMFLLARCDALVYNNSLFNQYARVLTGCFSGNQVHIETLFAHRRARQLSAAVRRRLQ